MTQSHMTQFRMTQLRIPALLALALTATLAAQTPRSSPQELRWALHSDPKTFDPARVDDAGSELVRYLTAGVLIRVDRQSMQPVPALASSWTLTPDGRTLTLRLRPGLRFSDGSPLTSADAASSIRRVLAPATAAPVAEEFLTPAEVRVEAPDPLTIRLTLPRRVVGLLSIFDEIAVEPANRPSEARVTAGPYTLAAFEPGQSLTFRRNPNYWRHDAAGVPLPYAPSIRLDVLGNRELEAARFVRGDYDLIDALTPDYFNALAAKRPGTVRDLGPSLNTEQLWFNQAPAAPLPEYEKAWFRTQAFRVAVSESLRRADLARIGYAGHATPAFGFISPGNAAWYDRALRPPPEDRATALKTLAAAGFQLLETGGAKRLVDAGGHPVRFSILTNTGNVARARMAAMIQQDLAALGMEVTVVTLDFPALIDRLQHTQSYESCLLGHPNVDPDPNTLMNEWLSSSPNHQWNPSQKTPATAWEAEIDTSMRLQATSPDPQVRKRAIDRVQQIVAEQQPFIYLVYPNALAAVGPQLKGVRPTIFEPGLVWNIEELHR